MPSPSARSHAFSLDRRHRVLKQCNNYLKQHAEDAQMTILELTKVWTSIEDSKGYNEFLKDKSRLIAMAREELYVTRAHHIFIYPSRIVQKLLSKTPSDDYMISTLYSDTKTRDFTISAHTNLILLDALLNTGKFQDYFSHAN